MATESEKKRVNKEAEKADICHFGLCSLVAVNCQ